MLALLRPSLLVAAGLFAVVAFENAAISSILLPQVASFKVDDDNTAHPHAAGDRRKPVCPLPLQHQPLLTDLDSSPPAACCSTTSNASSVSPLGIGG